MVWKVIYSSKLKMKNPGKASLSLSVEKGTTLEKVLGGESGTKQKVLALTFNTKPRANARLDLC